MRYRWDSTLQAMVDNEGHPFVREPSVPSAPMIIRDIEPYPSPMTGEMITSRSEARYDLDKHNCRIAEPDESPTKGGLRNVSFAKKHGLEHLLADDVKDAVRAGT
jgi:hypothetical protein